jgi:hypothetical protein
MDNARVVSDEGARDASRATGVYLWRRRLRRWCIAPRWSAVVLVSTLIAFMFAAKAAVVADMATNQYMELMRAAGRVPPPQNYYGAVKAMFVLQKTSSPIALWLLTAVALYVGSRFAVLEKTEGLGCSSAFLVSGISFIVLGSGSIMALPVAFAQRNATANYSLALFIDQQSPMWPIVLHVTSVFLWLSIFVMSWCLALMYKKPMRSFVLLSACSHYAAIVVLGLPHYWIWSAVH